MKALIAFSALLFVGCASVPLANSKADADAKLFAPQPNLAQIYVVRESGAMGSALVFPVEVDGRRVASLASGTYVVAEVEPGEHVISISTAESADQKKITAEAGKNYFFLTTVRMGWSAARVSLTPAQFKQGSAAVLQASRVDSLETAPKREAANSEEPAPRG